MVRHFDLKRISIGVNAIQVYGLQHLAPETLESAGWIAERVTSSRHGLIMNIIVGIAGSYLGGFLANAMGLQLGEIFSGWFWGNLIVSAIGAIILLGLYRMISSR